VKGNFLSFNEVSRLLALDLQDPVDDDDDDADFHWEDGVHY